MSLYGKGERVAWGVDYDWKNICFSDEMGLDTL